MRLVRKEGCHTSAFQTGWILALPAKFLEQSEFMTSSFKLFVECSSLPVSGRSGGSALRRVCLAGPPSLDSSSLCECVANPPSPELPEGTLSRLRFLPPSAAADVLTAISAEDEPAPAGFFEDTRGNDKKCLVNSC